MSMLNLKNCVSYVHAEPQDWCSGVNGDINIEPQYIHIYIYTYIFKQDLKNRHRVMNTFV